MHVDEKWPGDRNSNCHGLMRPIKVHQDGKKGWIITHKCMKCGKILTNKADPDDDFETIIKLTQETNQNSFQKDKNNLL